MSVCARAFACARKGRRAGAKKVAERERGRRGGEEGRRSLRRSQKRGRRAAYSHEKSSCEMGFERRRDRRRDVNVDLWIGRRRAEGDDLDHLTVIGHGERVAERERGERAGKGQSGLALRKRKDEEHGRL